MGNDIKYKSGDRVTVKLEGIPEFEAKIMAKEQWNADQHEKNLNWFLSLAGVKPSIKKLIRILQDDDDNGDGDFTIWKPQDYDCIDDIVWDSFVGTPPFFRRQHYLWTLEKYFRPSSGIIAEEYKIKKEIYGKL
jgi:hypothetical protein